MGFHEDILPLIEDDEDYGFYMRPVKQGKEQQVEQVLMQIIQKNRRELKTFCAFCTQGAEENVVNSTMIWLSPPPHSRLYHLTNVPPQLRFKKALEDMLAHYSIMQNPDKSANVYMNNAFDAVEGGVSTMINNDEDEMPIHIDQVAIAARSSINLKIKWMLDMVFTRFMQFPFLHNLRADVMIKYVTRKKILALAFQTLDPDNSWLDIENEFHESSFVQAHVSAKLPSYVPFYDGITEILAIV